MSFPTPTNIVVPSLNPIENTINSFNSNPYFIGFMMLLLNLGGRHFATSLTPEQDKIFQSIWFRRFLIFVIFFVGTRNIMTSFIMSIVFIIVLGFLFNDQSSLFLFTPSIDKGKPKELIKEESTKVLTSEEADIHKKLSDKIKRSLPESTKMKEPESQDISNMIMDSYFSVMSRF